MLIPFEQLFRRHNIRPDGVLHLGANSGQEADEYNKFKIPRVIWVEALPNVYQKLVDRVGSMPGHLALKACLSDKDGELVKFNVASNEGQSSSFLEFGTHSKEHPTVKWVDKIQMETIRVDSLLKGAGIRLSGSGWFLNADLQGAELLAMRGMGSLLDHFDSAYVEVNEKTLYVGCPLVGEIDAFLEARGFRRVETKMTGSAWGDALYLKR